MTLNEIAKISYETAKKRQSNGAKIDTETLPMLKHCAGEVVEATEASVFKDALIAGTFGTEKQLSKDDVLNLRARFASELADIICCCAIIAYGENIDLDKAIADCLEKNSLRAEGKGDKK